MKLKIYSQIFLAIFTIFTGTLGFQCPESSLISPCTCTILDTGASVSCADNLVTQQNLEEVVQNLRLVNDLTSDQTLPLTEFKLSTTNLTQLDMTPFLHSQIDVFYINANAQLERIVGPSVETSAGLIESLRLVIEWNPSLTVKGLGDTLYYFMGINSLFCGYNNLGGDLQNGEMIPGIFNLSHLSESNLQGNQMKKLGGGQFKGNLEIQLLRLRYNSISQIDQDAFLFDDPDPQFINVTLNLDLSINELTHESFSINSGLGKIKRPVFLDLWGNQIETLPAEIFEKYLEARVGNSMNLESNPLICDSRLKWLKNRRGDFENYVTAPCDNDPGQTAFTSELID